MNSALVRELYEEIDAMPIVDVHTHVAWKAPTATNIGEILSYHYYTELANSADYQEGKFPFDDPEELTRVILPKLALLSNTVQYDWLMTISREYLYLDPVEWYPGNWKWIFDRSVEVMGRPEWREELVAQSGISRVFLTNQYNDDLDGLDTSFYSPCLRAEPFILWMNRPEEREGIGALLGRPGHEGLIHSEWVSRAVGGNSLFANFFASFAGVFMYFATLTEVPILQGLIGSGMGKGPALALLLAGPALSLPNMLVIRSVLGTKKTVVFVMLVIVMATISGMIYGILIV